MKVIILAAGRGERLMPLTKNTPKSLLEIKNGVTVLENQLTHIAAAGVKDIVIVTGYRSEQVEAKVKSYEENIGVKVKIIFNPFFSVSNNLMSLWFARPEMSEDFIILNGDDVFDEKVMQGLLSESPDKMIVMVTDRKDTYVDEDMKIYTKNGQIIDVGKDLSNEKAHGESIGMIRVTGKGRDRVCQKLDEMVRKEESKQVFYLQIFRLLAQDGWPIYEHVIKANQWSEIDFHGDMILVQEALKRKGKDLFGS